MLRIANLDEDPNGAPGPQLEADDHVNPEQRAALEVPGGAMVNRKDSRSTRLPSDGSPSGRGPNRESRCAGV